ncbi:MAG TPA: hypothetical protein VFU76_03800 [Terriglobales bacterium]|nr:hypothetical protein [Terriglobales bacterium]
MEKTFDGNFSREELENTLNTTEQLEFVRLTKLQKRDASPPANTGTFEDDDSPDSPKPLVLVALNGAADLPATIARQLTQKRKLACQGQAYVSGVEKLIAIFR